MYYPYHGPNSAFTVHKSGLIHRSSIHPLSLALSHLTKTIAYALKQHALKRAYVYNHPFSMFIYYNSLCLRKKTAVNSSLVCLYSNIDFFTANNERLAVAHNGIIERD